MTDQSIEAATLFVRSAREGGHTFVTCPRFPGFSFMLVPGENDVALNEAFVAFLTVLAERRVRPAAREADLMTTQSKSDGYGEENSPERRWGLLFMVPLLIALAVAGFGIFFLGW